MCFTNRFLGTREICYSDCLLTLGLINGNQAFWRIPSSPAFPFPCSLGRNQGFESNNTTASSSHLVVNIFIIPLSPMLFKGIHLKYVLLCSGRKSLNSIQTRSFRNAERYNSRLCSSFPHSLFADLVSPCWRSLLRPKVSGSCYSTTHSYMASSPLPAPCISTSLSSIHPIFSLIWSTPLILLRNTDHPPPAKHHSSRLRAGSN